MSLTESFEPATEPSNCWHDFLTRWPAQLPRRGVVVTALEQIPFDGFMLCDRLLLLERRAPDSLGARTVLVPLAEIQSLKFTDVVKSATFQALGFRGKLLQG